MNKESRLFVFVGACYCQGCLPEEASEAPQLRDIETLEPIQNASCEVCGALEHVCDDECRGRGCKL